MRNTITKLITSFCLVFTFVYANGQNLKQIINEIIIIESKSELINFNAVCTPPTLVVVNPLISCPLTRVDLTSNQIITINTGVKTTFWQDANATLPLDYATGAEYSIQKAGTYYIKIETSDPTCFTIKPVVVSHRANPILAQRDTSACQNTLVTITYPIRAGISYVWPYTNSTSNSITTYPNSYVPHTVYINDSFGCQHIDEFYIEALNVPQPLTDFLCKETEYNFNEIADYSFLSGPANVTIHGDRRVSGFTVPGEYKFEISNTLGCKSDISLTKKYTNFNLQIIQPTCDATGKPQNNGKIKFIPDVKNIYQTIKLSIGFEPYFSEINVAHIQSSNEIYSTLGNVSSRTAINVRLESYYNSNLICVGDTVLYIEPSTCGDLKGSIGNYVFEDMNGNGLQDAADKPISNVKIDLFNENGQNISTKFTNSNGQYLFDNLASGTYSVLAKAPIGFYNTQKRYDLENIEAIDANNSVYEYDTTTLYNNVVYLKTFLGGKYKDDFTVDFGYYKPASIGNFVWNDLNRDGLQNTGEPGMNLFVSLTRQSENRNSIFRRSENSINGKYLIGGLLPGYYALSLSLIPEDYKTTLFNVGTDDSKNSDYTSESVTKTIFVQSGQIDSTFDAGIHLIPGNNRIYVSPWVDNNQNSIKDDFDYETKNIFAFLWLVDHNGTLIRKIDTAVVVGDYLQFDNVDFAKFKIEIPLNLLPSQYNGLVLKDKVNDDIYDSDINPLTGFSDIIEYVRYTNPYPKTVSVGVKPVVIPKGTIEGVLFHDMNASNTKDDQEAGFQNLKILLIDYRNNPAGVAIDSVFTDVDGKFSITNNVGYYNLRYTIPAGFKTDVSFPLSQSIREVNTSSLINIGFYQNAKIESIIWDDANGNGIQDIGEKGVPNIEVSFATGVTSTTYYTNQNGFFKIENIRPGQFSISVKFPNGYTTTKSNQGTNDDVDSDFIDQQYDVPSGGFLSNSISSGQFNLSFDFGLVKTASLGDYVWEDSNRNGLQDFGEKPIVNAQVILVGPLDLTNYFSKISSTDLNGKYKFEPLRPGRYKIYVSEPIGYRATTPNVGNDSLDSDLINLNSHEIILSPGLNQYNVDAGFFKNCSLIQLEITTPPAICLPKTLDLTSSNLIAINTGLTTTYWQDYETTIPLDTSTGPASMIKKNGQYFIKSATQDANCYLVKPVYAQIGNCQTLVRGKVYLEGFWNGTSMNTALLTKNLIPKKQPFNVAPWNYMGTESVTNFPANVSDWVLLVVRNRDAIVFAKKPAFIRNDGILIDIDGREGVPMGNFLDKFIVSIHHKSHLGVVPDYFISNDIFKDLTQSSESVIGVNQLKQIGSNWFLHAGDLDGNGIINSLDYNKWKTKAATVNQYIPADIDGNGIVNNLDYNFWTKNRSKVGVWQISGF